MRRVLVFVAVAALVGASPAAAATVIDQAVSALTQDPVYVDPGAEKRITGPQERQIEDEIATAHAGPVYVVILPESADRLAGGDPAEVLRIIHNRLQRDGTYAGVIGNHFRALSTSLRSGEAGKLATKALDAHGKDGVTPTLVNFVDRVADARNGNSGDSGGGASRWLLIVLIGGGIFAFVFLRNRAGSRRRARAQLAEVKKAASEDLVALAEDVQGLEHRVEGSAPATEAYNKALAAYGRASDAFDSAGSTQELAAVAEALKEGRYEMAVAEAAIDGRPAPERREPCFFDPRHGPSTRDVEWTPDGGAPRLVPACEADALRVESGQQPESRQVAYRGATMPYWEAPPMYGGYFGGFLPGLLVGSLFSGPSGSYADSGPSGGGFFGSSSSSSSGSRDDGGGGDFGGGGGDSGGGGGGGGDFGGGGGDGGGGGGGDF